MAFARDVYTATASQTDFTITFPYQAEEDVTVYQNGSLVDTADYTFPNATTVRLDTGATEDDTVVLQRSTSQSTRDVDFTAGPITEADLDNAAIQNFYMAQECLDQVALALGKDTSEIWDAESIRIQNVGTPTVAGDAARKDYVDDEIAAAVLSGITTPLNVTLGGTGSATAPAARVALAVPGVTTQTTAADADDDDTAGYTVGDIIVDTTADKAYIALDVTDEAAVWQDIDELPADNSITLAKMEHGTSGDILYYGASGTPTRLAKGSDTEVLTLASGLPSWAAGAASGGWEFVDSSGTISGDPAAIEFQDLDTGYDHMFVFDAIGPATDSTGLQMTTSPDTGGSPTYDTTSGDYEWSTFRQSSTGGSFNGAANASDTHVDVTDVVVGNLAIEVFSGIMEIINPGNTTGHTRGFGRGSYGDTGGGQQSAYSTWSRQAAEVVSAVRFAWSSGNFANLGSIRHYRRATS